MAYKVRVTYNGESVFTEFETEERAEEYISIMRAHRNIEIERLWNGVTERFSEDVSGGPIPVAPLGVTIEGGIKPFMPPDELD